MDIINEEGKMRIMLEGRLDTITAPELTEAINGKEFTELTIDLENLQYISSAGLRALLVCKKEADKQRGKMTVEKPCAAVFEVMRMSGFNKILNINEA